MYIYKYAHIRTICVSVLKDNQDEETHSRLKSLYHNLDHNSFLPQRDSYLNRVIYVIALKIFIY